MLPDSHLVPPKPSGHEQLNAPFAPPIHTPLFRHGFGEHGSKSFTQNYHYI